MEITDREIRKIVGNNIRKARREADYTIADVATLMDMDSSHISKMELGKAGMDITKLMRMAVLYNFSFEKVFSGIDDDAFITYLARNNSLELESLNKDYLSLQNPDHRKAVRTVINGLQNVPSSAVTDES